MALTLAKAEGIIKGACQKAAELGIKVAVAVVDSGGHLMALSRMDGAAIITSDMARDKAFTSAVFRADTQVMSQFLGQVPFFAAGPQVAGGRLVPLGGGVPMLDGNDVIGAVGVGGGTPEQDADCAKAGISAGS